MAQRPSFGALKKAKPSTADIAPLADDISPAASASKPTPRIQTLVRLHPAMWAALNDPATRKRIEDGRRVTVHDLLIEGSRHILAANGVKLSE
jgi:hypothetical protein